MEYIYMATVIFLIFCLWLAVYSHHKLKKSIKDFMPIINKTSTMIGRVIPFTDEQDIELAKNKEILRMFLAKIDYRIASFAAIQNTNYRLTNVIGDHSIHNLKTDSEKWMEQWKMSGYLDVRQDIEYLISKQ